MPTLARLVAGVGFSLISVIAYFYIIDYVKSDGMQGVNTILGAALVGFVCGWIILGSRPHFGGWDSLGSGILGMLGTMVWLSVVYGIAFAFLGMTKGIYSDPFAMVITVMYKILYLFVSLLQWPTVIPFVFGALVFGRLAGLANKYYE